MYSTDTRLQEKMLSKFTAQSALDAVVVTALLANIHFERLSLFSVRFC